MTPTEKLDLLSSIGADLGVIVASAGAFIVAAWVLCAMLNSSDKLQRRGHGILAKASGLTGLAFYVIVGAAIVASIGH
jgi:hypothetical protein